MKKDLDYYRLLPYARRVDREEEEGAETYWVASVVELSGCMAHGASRPEAILQLNSAFDEYIEAMLGWGKDIPEPERTVKARGGFKRLSPPSAATSFSAPSATHRLEGHTFA